MEWPVHSPPLADTDIPIWHVYYLGACRAPSDPTMIWGTDVDVTGLDDYLQDVNRQSASLVSPAHVLVRAVASAIRLHPEINRRVIGSRVYRFKQINVMMALFNRWRPGGGNVVIERADELSLGDVAAELWRLHEASMRNPPRPPASPRLERIKRFAARHMVPLYLWFVNNINQPALGEHAAEHGAGVHVNYIATRNLAPLQMYKASRFPCETCLTNVTMGAAEKRPAVINDQIVIRKIAPLFVRSDHRIIDASQLGPFVASLRRFLMEPALMEGAARIEPADAGADKISRAA